MARRARPNAGPKRTAAPQSPAEALVRAGVDRLAAEDYQGAADAFTRAVARDWKHAQARLFLARAHGMLGRLDECAAEIERLVSIAGRDAAVLGDAGRTLARFGRFERALAVFEKAAAADRGGSGALTQAASAAERLGRLDEASAFAAGALERDTDDHEARLIAARVHRRRGDLDAADAALAGAIGRPGAPDELRAKQWYERAAVLDALERYGEAAAALGEAKACLRAYEGMYREAADEAEYTLRRLVQELSPERIARWTDASAGLPPARLAALVGFPRSGTTLLERILDAHPLIESVEETTHWSSELVAGMQRAVPGTDSIAQTLDRVPIDAVTRCREHYLSALASHIDGPIGERHLLDKNPIRTLVTPVLRRAVPDAKIIVALRDPRDVVLSNLMQAFDPSPMNLAFLDVARAGAFYALNMEGWVRLRGLIGGWVEVRYEDVVTDAPAQARRALDLFGLAWDDRLAHYQEHMGERATRSPTYAAVREKIHTRAVRRWERYADYLGPAMGDLTRVARALGYE